MNPIIKALAAIISLFDRLEISYMVFGGIANSLYGSPGQTKDWMDIHYIIENLKNDLDWRYLLKHCKELSKFLDDPEIYTKVEKLKNG